MSIGLQASSVVGADQEGPKRSARSVDTKPDIVISARDHWRLERLLNDGLTPTLIESPYVRSLQTKLDLAKVVPPDEMPSDVVTMNSRLYLRAAAYDRLDCYTLVYPELADIARGRLSVLAPIGSAILGRRVSDRVTWSGPRGAIRFEIERLVFQPERNGELA